MAELEEIITLIYDAAVDDVFVDRNKVQKWLDNMSSLDKEILQMVAFEYWDKGYGEGYNEVYREIIND